MAGAERLVLNRESSEIAISLSTMAALSSARSEFSVPIDIDIRRLFESRPNDGPRKHVPVESAVRGSAVIFTGES